MRHKALPYLLPALQILPPLLGTLYDELGYASFRTQAERSFRSRVVGATTYTHAMLAPRLQAQLSPWVRVMVQNPEVTALVTAKLLDQTSAAVQEAVHWAYAFEAGTRLVAAGDGAGRGGETRDMRVLFVPLVCEQAEWAPTLPPLLMQQMRSLLYAHGIVQPDEMVLIAPPSLAPATVTQLVPYTALIEFALAGAERAWGAGALPLPDAQQRWDDWWRQPPAPAGAPTLRPLEVRLALMVVASPDPSHRLLDQIAPWQEEARTELLLSDRFDSASLLEFDSYAEVAEASQQAFVQWVDVLNGRLADAGLPTLVAAPPSDAYSACGRGAVEAACQFVRAAEEDEDEETPVFLIADSAGLAVELGGAGQRLAWAPEGVLMPAMVPVIEEVVQATSGRQVERSVTQELDRLALIGSRAG